MGAASLEDQVDELKTIVGNSDNEFTRIFDLTKYPGRMMALLLARKFVSHEAAFVGVYFDVLPEDRPDSSTSVKRIISTIRKVLRPLSVKIRNQSGDGYWIDEKHKTLIREAVKTGIKPKPTRAEIVIEKAVPIPALVRAASIYPFGEMEPGDSFFCPKSARAVLAAKAQWLERTKSKAEFTSRKVDGGVRIWRVS